MGPIFQVCAARVPCEGPRCHCLGCVPYHDNSKKTQLSGSLWDCADTAQKARIVTENKLNGAMNSNATSRFQAQHAELQQTLHNESSRCCNTPAPTHPHEASARQRTCCRYPTPICEHGGGGASQDQPRALTAVQNRSVFKKDFLEQYLQEGSM